MNLQPRGTRCIGGFTLIEILIVVAIMAIVASAVIVSTVGATDDAQAAAIGNDLQAIARAATRYKVRQQRWPASTTSSNAPGDFAGILNREAFLRIPSIAASDQSRYGWFAWRDRYAASYVSFVDLDNALAIDEVIDDGLAESGNVRIYQWTAPTGTMATIALWLEFPG